MYPMSYYEMLVDYYFKVITNNHKQLFESIATVVTMQLNLLKI